MKPAVSLVEISCYNICCCCRCFFVLFYSDVKIPNSFETGKGSSEQVLELIHGRNFIKG